MVLVEGDGDVGNLGVRGIDGIQDCVAQEIEAGQVLLGMAQNQETTGEGVKFQGCGVVWK